ncbi:uncharacterized protein LOC143890435 [Tasmannia lanceolata]|uniref:uncharacterized protein LOC143890435 n=1 Tax=Tasmannia lanceolata TaxID=3420 RepID=UPI00406435E7
MRSAAKVATFGAYRSVPTAAEQAATALKASRIASSPAIDETNSLISSQNGRIDGVQRPPIEIDDWDLLFDSMDPMPRVVFGKVPTLQEAKEATSDLKDAVDQIYFSPSPATSCGGAVTVSHGSSLSVPLSLKDSMTKPCVTSESTAILPSAPPKHVLNAFALLKESPEVENVVASIAADKNIWEAVMKNDTVREFYQSHQTNSNPDMKVAFAGNSFSETGSVEAPSETSENGFTGFVKDIKLKVVDMVSNLSEFFNDVFGNSAEERSSTGTKENTTDFVDKTLGASFIALAIVAMIVILFKRA